MRWFARTTYALIGVCAIGLATDYVCVRRKEYLLSNAVADCGGRMGSIPFWPLGIEYRITLMGVPTEAQLEGLAIANQMRGRVDMAFVSCEIADQDAHRLQAVLPSCRLFVVKNGVMTRLVSESESVKEQPRALATGQISTGATVPPSQ